MCLNRATMRFINKTLDKFEFDKRTARCGLIIITPRLNIRSTGAEVSECIGLLSLLVGTTNETAFCCYSRMPDSLPRYLMTQLDIPEITSEVRTHRSHVKHCHWKQSTGH